MVMYRPSNSLCGKQNISSQSLITSGKRVGLANKLFSRMSLGAIPAIISLQNIANVLLHAIHTLNMKKHPTGPS